MRWKAAFDLCVNFGRLEREQRETGSNETKCASQRLDHRKHRVETHSSANPKARASSLSLALALKSSQPEG